MAEAVGLLPWWSSRRRTAHSVCLPACRAARASARWRRQLRCPAG